MRSVLPNLYYFDFAFTSPKLSNIKIDGKLGEWTDISLVPDLMHMRGSDPFAQVYFGWDDDNLYLALEVPEKRKPVEVHTSQPWRGDSIEVWIDTRNDKTQRRYTEHCHHFFFIPKGRKDDSNLATALDWKEPGSPLADTIFDHPDIEITSVIGKRRYSFEVRIPSSVIHTYDPVNHPFIGFNYHINDADRRSQWWSCGQDFSRHTDPSTWGTVQLVE